MSPEKVSLSTLLPLLFDAAKREDWETVDSELLPQLSVVDSNQAAQELLNHVSDTDPNIRDVVASALEPLTITDPQIKEKTVLEMIGMTTTDTAVFPAGRAATVLLKYQEDENLGPKVQQAL